MSTQRTVGTVLIAAVFGLAASGVASAQDVPAEYRGVLTALGKKGDFKDGVLKVNIPRGDLRVTIAGRGAPTPLGFGGWIALTKGTGGAEVLMGDLVLTHHDLGASSPLGEGDPAPEAERRGRAPSPDGDADRKSVV